MFLLFGWIPLAITFLWGVKETWLFYIKIKWDSTQKFVLLAIDIPRSNEQTVKAVENMFTYFGGAHATLSLIDKYWEGKFQLSFSFEVVSIEGYTQFLIRTPVKFRDLVESAVYSQYSDAEIVEVNDYTEGTPDRFPDDEYDIHGGEFIQANKWVYPIKVHKEFEHLLGAPGSHYKDPMASLMDLYSSLGKGEQVWLQFLVTPMGFDWPKEGEKEIDRIISGSASGGYIWADKIVNTLIDWIGSFSESIYKLWGDIPEKRREDEDDRFLMMNLRPKQKRQIEAIQEKIGKLGFEFKCRYVYLAKKEVINKPKVFSGLVGFMKQFMDLDLNNLKPDMDMTVTTADYMFKNYRLNNKKNRIMRAYKGRSTTRGRNKGVLNVEELATLWHFPMEGAVKSPLIQKAPGRKAEAPMHLPIGEEIVSEKIVEPEFMEEDNKKEGKLNNKINDVPVPKGAPPANLPTG